ncbi:MAG: hypothetical protein DSZ33_00995, partial [Gammaproteobacteria bacterium]
HDLLNLEIPSKEARKIGFPLSEELVLRERIIADGTPAEILENREVREVYLGKNFRL